MKTIEPPKTERNFFNPIMPDVGIDESKIQTHTWRHKYQSASCYTLGVIAADVGYSLCVFFEKGSATTSAARVCNNMVEADRELDKEEKRSLDKIRNGFKDKSLTLVGARLEQAPTQSRNAGRRDFDGVC